MNIVKTILPSSENHSESVSFESAFGRLEHILEQMNSNAISLDQSLKLFKEADQLINHCNKRLNSAEREVEVLIKNRQGDLVLGSDQKPTSQGFEVSNQASTFLR